MYPEWTERCLATCKIEPYVIDNTIVNKGVAGSWNIGIDYLEEEHADWLVILSAALRFGPPGGKDFIEAIENSSNCIALEAAHGIGWHLIAFHKQVFEKVGRFDENFWPAYNEDIDMSRRISLGFRLDPPYWRKVSVDVAIAGFAHGVDLAGVQVDNLLLDEYYAQKWGDLKGKEKFLHPFNNEEHDLSYWPKGIRAT